LGRGGMATVYLARDLKHDRFVALKVLHADLAAALGGERFLREIRLAARLQHPHVLSVHDSGDAAGQLWFTMPYVEGESLRARLERERQLSVADALRMAREIVARHSLDPVPPLRASRPDLPAAVERAAFKALAKTPADRFPTAGAFGDALTAAPAVPSSRWWARRAARYAAAVALLAVGSVLFWRRPIGRDTPSRGSARSIAVLPFANLSGDRNDEYFSDGMSE